MLLFGYGLAGRVFHAPLISAVPELSLQAIVTGDPDRQGQAHADVPGVQVIASSQAAIEDAEDIDLAVIAGANVTHLPLALACLQRGWHVVIDKPVAPDAASAEAIATAATRAGRLAIPFQNRRWDSDFLTLQRLIDEQPIGSVHRFESRIERMRPAPKGTWRESAAPEDLGGVLLDFGAHLVDQALALLGPVEAVWATARSTRFAGTADDDAQISLRHVSGAVSLLIGSQAASFGIPRFTALGTTGGIRIDACDTQEDALKSGRTPVVDDWGVEPTSSVAQVRLLSDGSLRELPDIALDRGRWDLYYPAVASAITGRTPPPVDMGDAVQNLRVLDGARVSARTGDQVTLEPAARHLSR